MSLDLRKRVLKNELIDHVDPSEIRALRSRRDLRLIDFWLGNSRWIVRMLQAAPKHSVVELGAGDGHLLRMISRVYPETRITGLDLIPPPEGWCHPLHWIQGDFFETLQQTRASTCVGSLVLHHFHKDGLADLGKLLQRFSWLIFSEPHRHGQALVGSNLFHPFVGEIVRHDMPASIRAGFQKGEIADSLRLSSSQWLIEESVTTRGTVRFLAKKA